jgi:hypothetical protein
MQDDLALVVHVKNGATSGHRCDEKTSVNNRYRYLTAFNPGLPRPWSGPSTSNRLA